MINLDTGGDCSIFDLVEHLIKSFEGKDNFGMLSAFVGQVVPDAIENVNNDDATQNKMRQEFLFMRIVARLSRLGKEIRHIFEAIDKEKVGQIAKEKFTLEIAKQFGVVMSEDDCDLFMEAVDSNRNGFISLSEF